MAIPLERFIQQIEDTGIMTGDTLKDFIPPKGSCKEAEELARELVRQKKLTKYQAEEVYRGKGKSLTLGNYLLMEKIGAGGMGQVFKAQHLRMKRIVAIKLLPSAMTKDKEAIARFEREVEAAAKISHPNIVAAFDADCANGVHFLVMELVEGSDLSALVKKHGPLSVGKTISYILQAAQGLEAAHKKGIVHRDIKPANLLLSSDGVVKILDMGLARLSGAVDDPTLAELTQTGAVMGTIDYMAPEQALNSKTADARADIYSLGVTLWYLLSGRAMYAEGSAIQKLLAHREQPIPPLTDACPEVTLEIAAVFQRMVAKRPKDRFQSMTEVIAALTGCSPSPTPGAMKHPADMFAGVFDDNTSAPPCDVNAATELYDRVDTAASQPVPRRGLFIVAGLVLAAVIAGLAWSVVAHLRTTTPLVTANGRPTPVPAPASNIVAAPTPTTNLPQPWTETEALAWVLDQRGSARLQPLQGDAVEIHEAAQIPMGEFHIESLHLAGMRGDIDSQVARWRGLTALRELDLSETELSLTGATQLERLPALTSLNVQGCPLGDEGSKALGRLTRLTFLRVGESVLIPLESAFPVSPSQRMTDNGLTALRTLSRLETLSLSSRHVTEAGVVGLIEYCPDLVSLQIERVSLKDSAVESLANLRHLRTLGLMQSELTDGAIEPLTRLKRLTQLNVQGSQISVEGVRRLQAGLPACSIYGGEYNLRRNLVRSIVQVQGRVQVSGPGGAPLEITDATFNVLPGEFSVQRIDLTNVRPLPPDLLQFKETSELFLADSAISAHDIQTFPSRFPVLTVLNLAGTSVTDREIVALAGMTSLQTLDLTRTKVTAAGLARFKDAHLTCQIQSSPQ